MRVLTMQRVFPLAAVLLGNLTAGPQIEIKVLSGKPEMVSGNSALVELSGPRLDGLRVTLNGDDVTRAFRPDGTAANLVARLEGLKPGPNVLEASAAGHEAKLRLV